MATSYCWVKYVNGAGIHGDWAGAIGVSAGGVMQRAGHFGVGGCREAGVPEELASTVPVAVLGDCSCCTQNLATWAARFDGVDERLDWVQDAPSPTEPGWQLTGPCEAGLDPDHNNDPALTLSPRFFADKDEAMAWLANPDEHAGGLLWSDNAQGMWLMSVRL